MKRYINTSSNKIKFTVTPLIESKLFTLKSAESGNDYIGTTQSSDIFNYVIPGLEELWNDVAKLKLIQESNSLKRKAKLEYETYNRLSHILSALTFKTLSKQQQRLLKDNRKSFARLTYQHLINSNLLHPSLSIPSPLNLSYYNSVPLIPIKKQKVLNSYWNNSKDKLLKERMIIAWGEREERRNQVNTKHYAIPTWETAKTILIQRGDWNDLKDFNLEDLSNFIVKEEDTDGAEIDVSIWGREEF